MSIELDWQEGEESPGIAWETSPASLPVAPAPPATIARSERTQGGAPDWLPRFLVSVLAGLLLGLLILAGVLAWRSGQGNERARQDIASAASLALDAWKNRDILLYADLLDSSDAAWKSRMVAGLRSMDAPASVSVDEVTLDGSLALAGVTETSDDGVALRKLAFFRLVDNRWLLAPPQPDAFGPPISQESSHFRITVRERDQSLLPDLVNLAEGAYVTLCGELRCNPGDQRLSLKLAYAYDSLASETVRGELSVLSPWLSGMTAEGRPAAVFEQELARQLALQLAMDKVPDAPAPVLNAVGDWAATALADAPVPGAETLPAALDEGTLLPLDFVWEQANSRPHIVDPLVNAQLHTMLAFARDTLVDDAVGRLLEAGDGPLPVVLQRAFRLDASTFTQDWLRWLDAEYSAASPQVG